MLKTRVQVLIHNQEIALSSDFLLFLLGLYEKSQASCDVTASLRVEGAIVCVFAPS